MSCQNHSHQPGNFACCRCQRTLCYQCTVKLRDRLYCSSCKDTAVAIPPAGARMSSRRFECPASWDALRQAVLGYLFCPLLLGPVAVLKGYGARSEGSPAAQTAVLLGWLQLFLWGMVALYLGRKLLAP